MLEFDRLPVSGTAGLNVPMFIALRRFTLLCTIVLERFMMAKKHDRSTIGAVGIMIGGAARTHACVHTLISLHHRQITSFGTWRHMELHACIRVSDLFRSAPLGTELLECRGYDSFSD